jgi:hypothetical protein
MHFGENQLSPGSLGISPLPTALPTALQRRTVRASSGLSPRLTLAMGSSPGFGPARRDTTPHEGVRTPFSDSLALRLRGSSPLTTPRPGNSPVHSSIGTPSGPEDPSDRPRAPGFRLSFTPLAGVLFTVPSRYYSAMGRRRYSRLGSWSTPLPTPFPVQGGTHAQPPPPAAPLRLRASHPLRGAVPGASARERCMAGHPTCPRGGVQPPPGVGRGPTKPGGFGLRPVPLAATPGLALASLSSGY